MNSATEKRFGPWPLAAVLVLTALSGCEEALLAGKSSTDAAQEEKQESGKTELFPDLNAASQRDVEAPDVFQVTEAGLWDGRPSLGGIWVAHPDVSQPERVKITNPDTKKSVTGALFRRERNLPGPALQVSSSAAEKLGMLAGAPARLEVVALRREKIEPPQPEPAAAPVETQTETTVADAEPPAEAKEKPTKRKWWQKKAPQDSAADIATEAAATGAAAAATAGAATSAANEAAASSAGEAAAAAAASSTSALTDPVVAPPPQKPVKRKWWQKKPADEITETPLDPIAGAAAAIEASEPTQVATSVETKTSNLTKPYVQIGTFGLEANAKAAAEKVSSNGLAAQVQQITSAGKPVWRVLVGPASTRAERRAILGDMKDLGFSDSFIAKK